MRIKSAIQATCLLTVLSVKAEVYAQAYIPSIHLLLFDESCDVATTNLNDDFSCDRIFVENSPWAFVNGNGVNGYVSDGELVFELTSRLLWFNDSQGVLMHREVAGDFKATTSLRVHQTSNPTELPDGPVQLAGLMARDPASDASDENYVFIVLGYDVNDISVETKNTIDGISEFEGPSWTSGEAELRICRLGSQFYSYKRLSSDHAWQIADGANGIDWPMNRPDLPETLQLGLNIYSSTQNFDITARFDYFRIDPVNQLSECTMD